MGLQLPELIDLTAVAMAMDVDPLVFSTLPICFMKYISVINVPQPLRQNLSPHCFHGCFADSGTFL